MQQKLQRLLLSCSPITKHIVYGHSMEPTFVPGDIVLLGKLFPVLSVLRVGDVVGIQKSSDRVILKRIEKISSSKVFVVGDNKKQSTDSRHFGWVDKHDIIGKVIYAVAERD